MYKIDKAPPKDVLSVIPENEDVIWHGRPNLRRFSLSALGLRYLMLYLLVISITTFLSNFGNVTLLLFLQMMFPYIISCCLAGIILVMIGISQVMPTVYVITSERIIIKSGFALIFMLNVPFHKMANIDKKVYNDGCGDISFKLIGNKRIPFFAGWPSVRPWYFNDPEPTFRCIPDVDVVALKLTNAAQSRISEKRSAGTKPKNSESDKKEMTA
ncbi:MAG: photosynthetic complex putative assembly protein PuhB [Pseudomonadota bacterium]|nr:photosynthetic complex putative assembly protein PuhB [Pseudomonadota bacterium]